MTRYRWIMAAALVALAAGCDEDRHVGAIAFSPDGTKIAYTAGGLLAVHDAAGGRLLIGAAEIPVAEPGFDWAPDGSAVVFASAAFGGRDVVLLRLDQPDSPARLTTHLAKESEPRFVLGDKAVAFVSWRDGRPDLYLMTLADRRIQRMTSDPLAETLLTADRAGTTLAFLATNAEGDRWLSLIRLPEFDRRLNIPLAGDPADGENPITALELSADGRHLAFLGPAGACLIDVDRARAHLKDHPEEPFAPEVAAEDADGTGGVALAPDGRRLAYAYGGRVRTTGLAFLVRGHGISHDRARTDRLPAWSPDGRLIALAAGGRSVEIRDSRGRHVRWLAPDPAAAHRAAEIALERGDAEQAVSLLEPFAGRAPDDRMRRLLASACLAEGKEDEALAICQKLGDHAEVGRIHLAAERYEEAAATFERLSEGSAERTAYLNALAALDGSGRRALAAVVSAELKRDNDRAAREMGRFVDRKSARGTVLGARYAYRRTEILADLAAAETGRSRRRGFRAVVAACREAIRLYPEAPFDDREAALNRQAFALGDELNDREGAVEALQRLLNLYEAKHRDASGRIVKASSAAADGAVRLIDACLDLNWPNEADRTVGRVAEWSFENDEAALDLCRQILDAFDTHHRYAAGTAALASLIRAYHLEAHQVIPLLAASIPPALADGKGPGLSVDALPAWAKARVLRFVRATQPGPARDCLVNGLNALMARTHDERMAQWERFSKRWRDRAGTKAFRALHLAADAVLGDGCLEADRIDEALDYYRDLARAQDRYRYEQSLAQYKTMRRQHPDVVAKWLAAERDTRVLYVPVPLALAVAEYAVPDDAGSKRDAVRARWTLVYDRFLSAPEGETPILEREDAGGVLRNLRDNVLFRAAAVVGPRREERYLRTLIQDYPESEFAGAAFLRLTEICRKRGTFYLACTLAEPLLPRLAIPRDAATVKMTVATLYAERLDRPDRARPLMQDVADNYLDALEWPRAQYWLAEDLTGNRQYAQAAARLSKLIERTPNAQMVADGAAQFDLARVLRSARKDTAADEAYVKLITAYRSHPAVQNSEALTEIWLELGPDARAALAEKRPDDLKRILPQLDESEQKKMRRAFPDIFGAPTTRPAP